MLEQFQLDLHGENPETRLQAQWAANQAADAHNWTTEAFAMRWVLGCSDWEWWRSFPEYDRRQWIHDYEFYKTEADALGREIVSFAHARAVAEEAYQRDLKHAQEWAALIREAWLKRKPCPIQPEPRFEFILNWAFDLARLTPEHMPESNKEKTL